MEHGIITSVNYRDGVVACNVQAVRQSNEYRDVPVVKTFGGVYRTPKPGQKVAMDQLDDGTRFIIGFITRDSSNSYPEEMETEEYALQVDDETYFRFNKQPDGSYDVDINASGEVNIPGNEYTDEKAQDAVGQILSSDFTYDDANDAINLDPHTSTANAHHERYSDDEAVSAVNSETQIDVDITGDADTLDGNHASDFAGAEHDHDSQYIQDSGGTLSGELKDNRGENFYVNKYIGEWGTNDSLQYILLGETSQSSIRVVGNISGHRNTASSHVGAANIEIEYGIGGNGDESMSATVNYQTNINGSADFRFVTVDYDGNTWHALEVDTPSEYGQPHEAFFTGKYTNHGGLQIATSGDVSNVSGVNPSSYSSVDIITNTARVDGEQIMDTGTWDQVDVGFFGDGDSTITTGFEPRYVEIIGQIHHSSFNSEHTGSGGDALGQSHGYATGSSTSDQVVVSEGDHSNSVDEHRSYAGDGEVIYVIETSSGGSSLNTRSRASISSFDSDGFSLNWSTTGANASYIYRAYR